MSDKKKLLTEVKKITGVNNLENLSSESGGKILEAIGKHKLSKEHLNALIEFVPSFMQVTAEALKSISVIATQAGGSQKEILESVHASSKELITILSTLSANVETDEARLKIAELSIEAGKLYLEFVNISKEMNRDNNSMWVKMAGIVGAVASFAVVVASVVLSGEVGSGGGIGGGGASS